MLDWNNANPLSGLSVFRRIQNGKSETVIQIKTRMSSRFRVVFNKQSELMANSLVKRFNLRISRSITLIVREIMRFAERVHCFEPTKVCCSEEEVSFSRLLRGLDWLADRCLTIKPAIDGLGSQAGSAEARSVTMPGVTD